MSPDGGVLPGQPCTTYGDPYFGGGGDGGGDGGGGGEGGVGFSFLSGGDFCSDFNPLCLPPPSLYESIWSNVLGLPTGLNCPQVGGIVAPLCGGVNPIMDANNGQQKQNSPACKQAKAQLSSIGHQLSALDSSLRHDYFKNQLAAAGVGCVYGMATGEAVETPAIGTPAAVGNCAVGALGGVAINNVQYIITNLGQLGTEMSMMGQEGKAVANVVSACY